MLNRIKTSQFTFSICSLNEVYIYSGYGAGARNLAQIGYPTDNVFSDGTALQMSRVTGNLKEGYVATLNLNVSS
ncbi:hypothetical protein [Undibacterium macrobrachii]|uniref:Uncharacterized protein n=1 Tax=Undibacterium macrobrachii TaxID=1119058 RepID=A0ABQ2XLU6_9BURK|nr:hypothetical protein [Undibacterium macrobrachii]GGX22342.1 hypothetical protein GCM10011282_30470 [Undibacterium macrobrachii]